MALLLATICPLKGMVTTIAICVFKNFDSELKMVPCSVSSHIYMQPVISNPLIPISNQLVIILLIFTNMKWPIVQSDKFCFNSQQSSNQSTK